jgi:hypothetical protein
MVDFFDDEKCVRFRRRVNLAHLPVCGASRDRTDDI